MNPPKLPTDLPTLLSGQRIGNLITYSTCCHEFPGAYAEFGVAKGGSLNLLAEMFPDRKIYGIDSFDGLPEPLEFELHKKGDFALTDAEYVRIKRFFEQFYPNVELVPGFSPSVFKYVDDEPFAFVHIDVDLYLSVKDALDFFYPRLVPGGILLFDDYGFDTTPGAKKAIDEWDEECSFRGEVTLADGRFVGQYIIVK